MRRNAVSYDEDFFAWTEEQARLLRNGKMDELDMFNLAEEIEAIGHRDRRELDDRLENLIKELLKWRLDGGARCGYWRSEIRQKRYEIALIVEDSPSLREFAAGRMRLLYSKAREGLTQELELSQPDFPKECPFTVEQILAEDFYPED
jgi:Domain of unknown function DUF29